MSELEVLKEAVKTYFCKCEPALYQTAEIKSESARLREVADKMDECDRAKAKLKELIGISNSIVISVTK